MKNKRIVRLIKAALLLIVIVCLIPVGQAYYFSYIIAFGNPHFAHKRSKSLKTEG